MTSFKTNIWKIYVFKFLLSLHFIGGVLVPFFLDWGKISFTQIMLLQSFFVFSVFLLEIPTGAVADYLGRKTSLIFAAISTALATLVYSSYPSFYIFLIGEFLWALGVALMSGADEALVYDSLKKIGQEKTSKKIFGKFNSYQLVAFMVGAPIGSAIAAYIGLRYTMMLMSIPFLIAFFVAFSFIEPKTKKKIESRRYIDTLISGAKYFKSHKILKILAFDRISIAALAFFIIWTYQPLLQQLKVPIIYFGFIHAAMTGIEIPFMNNFGKLEKIFGSKKRYLLWSAIIFGVAFILLGVNTYVPVTILLLLIAAGFGLSREVLFQNYMNKYIESCNRATVISTVSMVDKFVRALLYPLIGLLVEWSLNCAIIIVGFAVIVFALISRVREEHLID